MIGLFLLPFFIDHPLTFFFSELSFAFWFRFDCFSFVFLSIFFFFFRGSCFFLASCWFLSDGASFDQSR